MIIVNCRYKKNMLSIFQCYIKVKIVKTSKYDLSCIYEILYSHSYWTTYNNF
jgi:hypothetical protein